MISVSQWREKLETERASDLISNLLDKVKSSDLNSYITLNEQNALELAEKYDKGNLKGKLAGVPVAVKDNITTRGLTTTCASRILHNYVPPFDSHVVERLKQEGAIIVGKTNMDEFGMGTTTETSYFGPVKNPHDTQRVAGGSSGGSAAVVSGEEAVLALGSDTGGSIRCPASFCGTVGLKPTYGLVSRYGLIPYANSLEQIGPIASNVSDLSLLMEVIATKDKRDSTNAGKDFQFKEQDKKLKVGVIKEMTASDEVTDKFNEAVDTIRSMGHEVGEVSLQSFKYCLAAYYVIAMSEASSNLARYDGVRYGHGLDKLDSWSRYFSRVRAEGFGDEVKRRIMVGSYALSAGYYGKYYLKALKVRTLVQNDFQRALKDYGLLISPTMPSTAFKIGELADPLTMYKMDVNTVPINMAGVPGLSMPVGMAGSLPVGMQIISDYFSENTILSFAGELEKELS
ncbi:MAG: Asp-tRNA(Asn)/Glu-tRNA(Gln) amidotransferase subunit GatA [Archaeoglobaceae archaeon]